jgi:hypothetical protein
VSEAITEEDRYVRGALGMGLTWAVGFIIVGNALNAFEWLFQGGATPNVSLGILLGASVGFIGGGVFSVALAVAGRRRRFDEMSLPRFAALGALVPSLGLVAMGVLGRFEWLFTADGFGTATYFVLMGAGFAAGILALARKAEDRELLEAGADVADVGLSKEEKRELLGT